MLQGIEFTGDRFKKTDDDNIFSGLTDNTIVICSDYEHMASLAEEILKTVNGEAEYNDYCCDEEDIGAAKYVLNFRLQKVIDINGQRITLCLEPAMVYKAKTIKDIWFFTWGGKDANYKESIYPMVVFKGAGELFDEGLDTVYKQIVSGCYGTYDGKWIAVPSGNNRHARRIL